MTLVKASFFVLALAFAAPALADCMCGNSCTKGKDGKMACGGDGKSCKCGGEEKSKSCGSKHDKKSS